MTTRLSVSLMSHEAVLLNQGSDFHTELMKAYRFLFAGTQSAVSYEFFVTKGMKKSHGFTTLLWLLIGKLILL